MWSQKKRPQLLFMRRAVGALCAAHPEWGRRPLRIVDVGGGKGFLARHLAEAFGANVSVVVLDRDARKIAYGQRAKAMPPNLEYVLGDASALLPGESGVGDVDVVVGLHACGALSDLVLAHAVGRRAAFCVVTCCFASLGELPLPPPYVTRDAWLGARVEASELKALLKASERQGDPELSRAAAHSVNALRAAAVRDAWEGEAGDGWAALLRFEARYSPRNYAVCGAPWAAGLEF